MPEDIKCLESEVVYQNKWMTVREDSIERASGAKGIYGVVEKPDCVGIIAVDNGMIHLVEQYRYPVKQRCWEIPQGAWESAPDADPTELAKGELREETGLAAQSMIYLGPQFLAYGFLNQTCHMFFASDLTHVGNDLDSEEEDLITKSFRLEDFERMLLCGEIKDSLTIAAYGMAKLKGVL